MNQDTLKRVKDSIHIQLGTPIDEITEATRLEEDLCVDSLDAVELCMELEEEFEISIDEEDIQKCKTVGDLVKLVDSLT